MSVKPNFPYHKYAKEISKYADNIDVYQSTSTKRLGKLKVRDTFITGINMYGEGKYYLSIVMDLVTLISMLTLLLIALHIPSHLTVLVGVVYVISCLLLGYVSYRFLALPRRNKEFDDLQSMSRYMTWDMLKDIQVRLTDIELKLNKKKRGIK
jgi:magnesium-transporting ATPase (P-type)